MKSEAPATDTTAPWQRLGDGVALVGSECPRCLKRSFPARTFCSCGNEVGISSVCLSRRGTLYAFTTVHIAPAAFVVPYVLGFVDLPEDVRVLAQIEPRTDLKIGDEVELFVGPIRRNEDGSIVDGYKFRKTGER
jgi:uncharacterized OB-fold protein